MAMQSRTTVGLQNNYLNSIEYPNRVRGKFGLSYCLFLA